MTEIENFIDLKIKRASAAQNRCAFPKCPTKQKLRTITYGMREKLMKEMAFYIPLRAKACEVHDKYGSWAQINEISNAECYHYDQSKVEDMISLLRSKKIHSESHLGKIQFNHFIFSMLIIICVDYLNLSG